MQQLATLIRKQLDQLVDQYDARLRGMPGYSNFPEAIRRDLERHFLNLIAESLEAGDYSALVQYAQQRAGDWAARGLNLAWFQQALIIPEELLVPLVQSVETSNFVWQALNRSQSAVWQMVTDRAHQTEERFRSIVETSHSGVLITDDAFHLTYVNDELVRISGYTREELLSTDFRQLFDEESRRIVLDHYTRRQRGEAVAPRYEVAFLRKDGTKRHIEMSAVALKDVNGKPYTVAQVLDISERKQAEQALHTSETQYQTIFDSTPIMFWLKDTQNRTLRVNKAAALFEGVQPVDVEGKSCYDVYPAEQAEAFYQDDLQVIRSGQAKLGIIEQHTSVGTGKLMWVETGKVPVYDERGEIVGVLAFAVDITARRETEAALERERNLLRTLIDTLPDQVFVKDIKGRLILYNQADARAMRLSSTEEALGKTVYDSYPRELADAYFADDMAVIESGQSLIDREELGQTEDGQERWVLTTKVPLKDQAGRSLGLVGIARDITQRKQIEATLQESEERFRRFSDATTEGLVFHDKGVILDANPAIVALFGFTTADELIGHNLLEFIVSDLHPMVLQKMQLDDVHPYEIQCRRKDGTTFPAETSTRAYPYGNRIIRASAVRDITTRKHLEDQIRESLVHRKVQVQTSVEVAQHIAAAPEIGELFHRVVTLVKERFNYYHVQLFRYVPAEDAVVLITGYGEIGQKMLAAGHKLTMGRGVVGTAAATGQSILAADVARDLDWRPNPNLPDTKGELAVPIKLGSGDAEAQVHALEHFATGSYAGIAVAAIDPEAIARITHKSVQRGKPVVAISIDLGHDHQTTALISVEHTVGYLLGVEAGTWAKRHLRDAQSVKIGMLTCRTLPNVVERERGIIDGIHSVIGEQAIVVVNADALESKEAAYLAEGWLHNYPDLNMIVAYNDATALGAYQAAQNAGRRDPDQFFIGGIDAVPEALEAIQQGGVYQATVNQPPEVMGIMAVRTLIAAIKGVPVKPVNTLYCALVNRSNAAEFTGPSREATILANQEVIPAEALAGFDVSGLRLGLSVLTLANPFFATLAASAEKEAQRLGVQLVINDPSQVLGVLDVQSDRVNALTDDDRLLLEGLCGQIASAIESTRLLEQLRQNETQLSEALKIAKLAYWEFDAAYKKFVFNDQFYTLLHTTAEAQGGYELDATTYVQRFIHPEDAPHIGATIARGLQNPGTTSQIEARVICADGEVRWLATQVNSKVNAAGHVIKTVGTNQDITERKLAEDAVRRSEAQLAEALKIAKLGYWEYDVEQDLFLFNDQFYALFHTTVDRVGGYQISSAQYAQQFVHPDDLPMVGGEIERALNSTDRHYSRGLVHRILYADGDMGYIAVNINIDRDEQGKILRYYGANQDITERKLAEAKLEELLGNVRESEQLMRTVIDSTSDWIFIKDQDHRYRLVNQGYANSLHIPIEEFIGKNDLELGFPEDLVKGNPEMGIAGFWADDRAVMDSGQAKIIPNDLVMIDGALRTYNTIKTPLRDGTGQVWGVLAFARDITDLQKAQEDLLARNTQLTAFNRLGQALAQILTVEEVVERVFQTAGEVFDNRNFYIALYDQYKQEISFPLYTIDGERRAVASRPFGNGMTEYILRSKRPLLIARDVQTFATSIGVDNIGRASRCYLGVPVMSGDISLGVMTVQDYEHENVYTQADVELLTAIATRMAAALENVRLYSIQAQRAVQLQTASEVSRAAASILNLDELLPQAVELIRTRFELYYVGIFLLDDAAQWAILRAGTGEAGHIMLANNHRLEIGGNSMISQCVVMQRARIALDVGEEAVRFDNPLLPLTRSEMALPLVSRGRIIGAMTIQSDQPAAFTADDITALQSMADQIGNAVENARLYAQTQAALGETDQLLQASAELNVSKSYNDVLDVIRKYTVLGQQALTIAVNVFDRLWTESQTPTWIEVIGYYTKRSSGIELGTRFPIAMFPSAKALLRPDAPAIIENFDTAQTDPNTYALFVQRFVAKSVIFMPLVVGGQWFGYMNVLYSNPTQFDQVDVRRLMAMVGQAAVAVQNLRNLATSQQTLTETEASYRATQAIGRAETVEGILEATTHVVDLIGMTRAMLRIVSRRDVNNVVMATDIYSYHHVAGQWVLQPVAKDVPAGDATSLRSLQRNPEAVVIYTDAQNPNSAMPDEVRQALLADQLRSTILTSVNLQNEVLGFLSFSGPQPLNETAEQRLRIAIRTLGDQVAVALQNRLLFEQTRAALQEVDAINRRLTGEAWENYLHQQAGREVIWLADDDVEAPEVLPQLDVSLTAGEITLELDPADESEATVTAPILLRGQPIGALRLRTPVSEWDEDSEAMLADIAGHIAQAVENARLVEQTQRTAQRERTINEINARVRQSVDLDAILRTAVNELGQSLKAARVVARVGTATADGATTATEGPTADGDGRGKTND